MAEGAGSFQSFIDSIMKLWPDYAAAEGIEPPPSVSEFSELPPVDQTVTPPMAGPTPPPVASAPLPVTSAPEPTPNPAPTPTDTEAAMAQNQLTGIPQGIAEISEKELFPTDMLQPPQSDIDNAVVMSPEGSSPLMAAGAAALSGIRAPQAPQYSLPSAPGIPATKDVNATLLQLLQAAGLQAPSAATGMNLSQRIR